MDRHVVAGIALTGAILDAVGGLYLAYDLLGGENGPLRVLTRAVTYTVVFALGIVPLFGLLNGLLGAFFLGIILAFEIMDAAHGGKTNKYVFAVTRAVVLGFLAIVAFDRNTGLVVGGLAIVAICFGYWLGASPRDTYFEMLTPGITATVVRASLVRGAIMFAVTNLAGALTHRDPREILFLSAEMSAVMVFMGLVVGILCPLVEKVADNMPPRRMGTIGAVLVLLGFCLQASQYLFVVLDIPVN